MTRGERHNLLKGLGFISPWIIGFAVFGLYPLGASLYYSFCDYDILNEPVVVGTLNYSEMAGDSVFWISVYNTVYFALFSIPLGLFTALMIAVLLNQKVVGRSIFRTVYFLPSIVPLIGVAMIWLWLFDGGGLVDYCLSFLGIHKGPGWLTDEQWVKPTLVLSGVWQVGGTIVIFLALQDVPRSLYESAEIDGATPVVQLRHITIPMISPAIYFCLVMGIIGALQEFVRPFVMLGGTGPNRSALFYAVNLYDNAFRYLNMGYARAGVGAVRGDRAADLGRDRVEPEARSLRGEADA
ncbi:MAG: sugar ABC transporter permease [Phycisphaerales bacterium]